MFFGYNLKTFAYTLYIDIVGYFQILKSDTVSRILCYILSRDLKIVIFICKNRAGRQRRLNLEQLMDDLRCYVLFNSIVVISGRWAGETERLWMQPFTVEKISPRAGLEPETVKSVSQRLTH